MGSIVRVSSVPKSRRSSIGWKFVVQASIVGLLLVMAAVPGFGVPTLVVDATGSHIPYGGDVNPASIQASSTDDGFATPGAATPAASTPVADSEASCSSILAIGERGDACVAIVHAAPRLGSVDLLIGGDNGLRVDSLDENAFVDFVALAPGDALDVLITAPSDTGTILLDSDITVSADTAYVLVIGGLIDFNGLSITPVEIDLQPTPRGTARVRIHHAVADAGPLAVLELPAPLDAAIETNQTGDSVEINGGRYEVTIVPGLAQETTLDVTELQFEPGLSYVAVLTGLTTDATLVILIAAAPVAQQ